ncbi:capsule biosynthesis protein [Zavarzinia sp.]|uniref:capsule biosynthesis protein n=1 Tax=Zavarzinia sp. TaxID=2027920 RepID=UPI003563092A
MTAKHFVFLQGMPSPFFTRIGNDLAARGHRVTGVNLCFGDWYFWKGPAAINYRGTRRGWPAFIGRLFEREGVTDLVLLGEQRAYHKVAIAEAKKRGVRVTVTDFGYLRPDWVTLEADGMGGNSLFPRDLATIRRLAEGAPVPRPGSRFADSFRTMAIGDLIYSFGNILFAWAFPFYRRSDKRANPFVYFPFMARRLMTTKARQREAAELMARMIAEKRRFFFFPLQLEHDFQVVAYSPFADLREPLRRVIASFARHAAADDWLMIKPHPWDPGLRNWRKLTRRFAAEHGVADRVAFIDGGVLGETTRASVGMVTVNSTSGVTALEVGRPLKVLGQAVYDIPGLAFQGSLDAFWQKATPPAAADVQAFLAAMAATIQIRGTFFSEPGLGAATRIAAERLDAGLVAQRLIAKERP